MFETFFASYVPDPPDRRSVGWLPENFKPEGFHELTSIVSGRGFSQGLYRLHSAETARGANMLVSDAFPEFSARTQCFGFDWLGRQFGIDATRLREGEPLVLMMEPGSGEVLEIPATFRSFHEEELVNFSNEALAREFFDAWATLNPASLPLLFTQCVGYRVPLFLGGPDELENLEAIDLEVYWTLCGQLLTGVRSMPVGTTIADLVIED